MVIISFVFPAAVRPNTREAVLPASCLGDWTIHWKNALGEHFAGRSRLSQPVDHALLKEEFEANATGSRNGWRGMTLAKFNAHSNTWHYAWQDNRGGYCDFIGQFKGQTFSLQFVDAQGERIKQRMVVQSITPEAISWDCEKYETKAHAWRKVWKIEYRRR